MSDRETLDVYDKRAAEYAQNYGGGGPGRHLLAFMDQVEPGARVLDLGCGPGASAAHLARAGFRVDAWDASAAMADHASAHEGVTARHAGFDDLTARGFYGGIWANFSLLHAPRADMDRHLTAIARALTPRGVFHIGMKTGEGAQRDGIGRFYTYYREEDLVARLTRAGFSILDRSEGAEKGMAGTIDPWVVILAQRNG
ncbi:MAG: class I SAM-dependent methyltransferase [Pseudomonadota bacterium]